MKEISITNPKEFILGGKSEFTIKNTKSGINYHYKVTKKNDFYFIQVKGGEYNSWTYAGFLNDELCFVRGNKGNCTLNDAAIKGIKYALKFETELPSPMFMYHHGKCACCGRRLTDEISIKRGFGPTCVKKVMGY